MKAIVLLSGGLDSAVTLALALEQARQCVAVTFNYGQRHRVEIEYAKALVKHYGVTHQLIDIDNTCFATSSLVTGQNIPKNRLLDQIECAEIPSTYVPARNTLFLAYATGMAEVHEAQEIHVGPNLLDRKPYPDCRPEFYQAFQRVLNLATKQAAEGRPPKLITPLIDWTKTGIVAQARRLTVPLELTFSCYDPTPSNKPCGECDACLLRAEALLH